MRKLDTEIRTILKALEAALKALPGVSATRVRVRVPGRRQYAPTAAYDVTFGGSCITIFVEVARTLSDRVVDERLPDISSYAQAHAGQAVLFAGERMTRPARLSLEAAGAGYFDIDGALLITAPPVYVRVAQPGPPVQNALRLSTLVQGQRARIVDHLLQTWPRWQAVKDIADQTAITPSVVSTTHRLMTRALWLDTEGSGPTKLRRIKDCKVMLGDLADYCANLPPISMRRFQIAETDPARICRRLARACENRKAPYAISGRFAAQLLAGAPGDARQIECRMKAGRKFSEVLRDLGARPAGSTWNLGIVVETGTDPVEIGERIGSVQYASPWQVWRDLVCGRSSERAIADKLAEARLASHSANRTVDHSRPTESVF